MDEFKSEIKEIESEILAITDTNFFASQLSLQVNRHIPKLDSLVRYSLFKDKKN